MAKQPGPKDQQFNKRGPSPLNRSGKLGSSNRGSSMQDQQFNKPGQSPGNRSGKLNGQSNSSSGMADEQFTDGDSYNALNDDGSSSKGKKTKGGMGMQVAGQLGPAQRIMQAVAQASQASGSIAKGKNIKTPKAAKSPAAQKSSYKNSTQDAPQPRAKSMNRGFGSK